MDTPTFHVGDLVVWKSIQLVVIEIKDNGMVEALSPTMRVTALPSEFQPFLG
jgi:signal peptidase I